MILTEEQLAILLAEGHLLVTGGPGSGKTTVSILKAARTVETHLRPGQQALFLSFARATVTRVVEAIEYEQQIPSKHKQRIDVATYHSFFWRILRTHGYLIGLPRKLDLLTPPAEAIALSNIRSSFSGATTLTEEQQAEKDSLEDGERTRLAYDLGLIAFDLFAPYVGHILEGSERIRRLLSIMYPIIILDEFQDTNAEQWRVVKSLGEFSTLVALADPEQRIYDWIGADPARLDHFRQAFVPAEFDLGDDNHRSAGTDIVLFGDHILRGEFGREHYEGVRVLQYRPNSGQAYSTLVTTTYRARERLVDCGVEGWSIGVLVPTKKLTRLVSDAFRSPPARMAAIPHTAVIESEAAILGADVIAWLMEPGHESGHLQQFIVLIRDYFRGKGGDSPTKGALKEAAAFQKGLNEYVACLASGKQLRRNSILAATIQVYEQARRLVLTGDPERDWLAVRRILEGGTCRRLAELAREVRNLRLLERGAQLRQGLSQAWVNSGAYVHALVIVRQAFVKEHFANTIKPETGVVVMNMHKAKGKQFDEVIIFEAWPIQQRGRPPINLDRIVRNNDRANISDQARQNLRVSVTRGKRRTTILTPGSDPCVLLPAG